jgi:hypothetical protein
MRPAGGDGDKTIRRACVGPARRQRFQRASIVIEKDPVLAPGLTHGQQLEALSEQGMERMGDFYKLPFTNTTGCS